MPLPDVKIPFISIYIYIEMIYIAIYREKTCKFEISYSIVRDALQNVLRLQRLRRPEIKLA